MDLTIASKAGIGSDAPLLGDMSARAPAPAPTILRNVSDEITRCADMVLDLQDAFASANHSGVARPDIRRMQSLDLLEQTLRDLSEVTASIVRHGSFCGDADLTKLCKLDDVARRLQGQPVAAHSGDADFF